MNGYPTIAEIKASHAPKIEYERYLLASRFVFRPLSFPAIWILVRLGVTGELASWLSGLSALLGFVCLLWPEHPHIWAGLAFLILFNFFDCLDGGIARITNARNSYGRFLDSAMWWADMCFWVALGLAMTTLPGLCATGTSIGLPAHTWAAAGVACSMLADYAAYLESTFDAALRPGWEKIQAARGLTPTATPVEGKAWPEILARSTVHNLRVRETHYLLLIPAFAFGAADLFLSAMLVFYAAMVVSMLVTYCRRGRLVRADELAGRQPGQL